LRGGREQGMCRFEELDFLSFLAARLDGEEKYAA
jgi:hypothetical protein